MYNVPTAAGRILPLASCLPAAGRSLFFLSQRSKAAKKSNRSLPVYCNHGFESALHIACLPKAGTWYFVPLT